MRRTTARELVGGVERFPVDARVAGLSEEWAGKALEALRVAVTRRNGSSDGEERGAGAGVWLTRRCPRLEM
jgi:hypothetical protein